MREIKAMLEELVKLSRTLEAESGGWPEPADERRDVERQERRIIAHVATIEGRRDAHLVAIKRLRSLFAGDPGGEFVVNREDGEGASLADLLLVGEAMAQADIAIDGADEEPL